MDIRDFNPPERGFGSLASAKEQMAGLGPFARVQDRCPQLDILKRGAAEAARVFERDSVAKQQVLAGLRASEQAQAQALRDRLDVLNRGAADAARVFDRIAEARQQALTSVSALSSAAQAARDIWDESQRGRDSAHVALSQQISAQIAAQEAESSRLAGFREALLARPPELLERRVEFDVGPLLDRPWLREGPMPLPNSETDDTRVADLEDQLEALKSELDGVKAELNSVKAERGDLAARCAAHEKTIRILRMARRCEVLDASQEHTPEPPVNESPYPDPK